MKVKKTSHPKQIAPARLAAAAEVLRVLGHPDRLRLVEILDLNGPAPVHEVMAQSGLQQAPASGHLNKMRRAGIIKAMRKGREMWYKVDDPRAITLLNCLRKGEG